MLTNCFFQKNKQLTCEKTSDLFLDIRFVCVNILLSTARSSSFVKERTRRTQEEEHRSSLSAISDTPRATGGVVVRRSGPAPVELAAIQVASDH